MLRLLTILFLFFCSCTRSQEVLGYEMKPTLIPNDMNGKTNVYIGNSITAGSNASDNAHRWTTLFSVSVGATEDNRGSGGRAMQGDNCNGNDFTNSLIPTYVSGTHGYLFIALGVNDIGQNNGISTPDDFEAKYLDAIDNAVTLKNWPRNKIVLLTPYYFTNFALFVGSCGVSVAGDETRALQYVQKVIDVSAEEGVYVIDTHDYTKNYGSGYFNGGGDNLHPGNEGHAALATFIRSKFE